MKPATSSLHPDSLDLRCTVALNRLSVHRPVQRLFGLISRLGDGVFWYVLIAMLALFGEESGRLAALQMAVSGALCTLLYRSMKRRVRRPRPFRDHVRVIARIRPLDEFSFPSGHTLHAVNFSIIAIAHLPILIWLLLPFALLVGLSRVVLGVHYPSDVLAATAIGAVTASMSLLVL